MARLNIVAEVTGTVWKIEAQVGAEVAEDDSIMVIESMKMEIPIITAEPGRVIEVMVSEGDTVEDGQVVAVIET